MFYYLISEVWSWTYIWYRAVDCKSQWYWYQCIINSSFFTRVCFFKYNVILSYLNGQVNLNNTCVCKVVEKSETEILHTTWLSRNIAYGGHYCSTVLFAGHRFLPLYTIKTVNLKCLVLPIHFDKLSSFSHDVPIEKPLSSNCLSHTTSIVTKLSIDSVTVGLLLIEHVAKRGKKNIVRSEHRKLLMYFKCANDFVQYLMHDFILHL